MTKLERIKELIKLLFGSEETVVEKFEVMKLKDGKDVKFLESFIVGAAVVTEPEGEVLADGEYELEDGAKFTVKEGKVEAIVPKEEPAEPAETVEPTEDMSEQRFKALEDTINTLSDSIVKLLEKFEAIDNTIKESNENFSKVDERLKKVESTPTSRSFTKPVKPIETPKKEEDKLENADDIAQRGRAIIDSIKTKK